MKCDFATLAFTDFEALSRDLLGRDRGIRIEVITEGVDGGIDARHATADGNVILHAKHYLRYGAYKPKLQLKLERATICALVPQR